MASSQSTNLYPNAPPPYEAAVSEPAPSEKQYGPFPPASNPSYKPQTENPTYPQPPTEGYQMPVPPSQSTVGQPATVYIGMPVFGSRPCNMTCPNCHQTVVTVTSSRSGLLTYLVCGGLLVIGCWAGCCLIPFCCPECQDIDHHCPNCKALLGTYKRI